MAATKRIKRALVSVYHKDGLDEILKKLHREGVSFVSTGGTQKFIEDLGLPCDAVEELTGYPSILGGRVKTLHPKVFGGILNFRCGRTGNYRKDRYRRYFSYPCRRKELQRCCDRCIQSSVSAVDAVAERERCGNFYRRP